MSLAPENNSHEKPHFSGKLLTRNVIINIAGNALPLFAAIVAIPFLISGLGTEKFGILALAWTIVGYFSMFDLGIGRATTKFVAEYLSLDRGEEVLSLIWTSLFMLLCLGVVTGIFVAGVTPLLVYKVFKLPESLVKETLISFYLLSLSLPFVMGTAGARGVLEAQQRFATINAIRIPASISNFIAPLVVIMFTQSLPYIISVLVALRALVLFVYLYFSLSSIPGLLKPCIPERLHLKKLINFGGWLTISSILGPLMARLDRFVIGAMLSMNAVAYYTVPFDLVTRLWIFSGSLLGVLFPVFSAYSTTEQEKLRKLYERALKYILIALSPMIFALALMAEPLLRLWLGQEFAEQGTLVLQVLSVGVLISSIGRVPAAVIQAKGRPDITAKLHMIELPIYLTMLWFFIPKFGIVGVAAAYTLRVSMDAGALLFISHNEFGMAQGPKDRFMKSFLSVIGLIFVSIYFTNIIPDISHKFLLLLTLTTSFLLYSWKFLLDTEKEILGSFMRKSISRFTK